jgi:sugar-specific transcriptional regulator TrmB/DNA-binding CsgD family transcriptional regulator
VSKHDPHLLGELGVSSNEERLWRALLRSPDADTEALATTVAIASKIAVEAMGRLLEHGLVSRAGSPSGFVALDPQLSIQARIAEEQRALAERAARLAELNVSLPKFADEFYSGRARVDTDADLRIVRGIDDIREQMRLAVENAKRETRSMLTSASARAARIAIEQDMKLYGRGIRCRTLVRADLLADSELYQIWEDLSRLGDQFRSLPDLPIQMQIVDDRLAIVPVRKDETRLAAIFIREPTLVHLMTQVFDHFWLEAAPLFDHSGAKGSTPRRAERVLEMISAGATDDAIARTLGVGVRTIRRDVAELRTSLGVGTRTEIVAAAIRQGWL